MKLIFIIFSLFYLMPAFAEKRVGMGGVATSLMEPVSVVSDFIHSGCLVLGISFVFASVVKYFEHRRSPLMVPISTIVFLLIAGIILLLLPVLSYLNSNAIPYSFFR